MQTFIRLLFSVILVVSLKFIATQDNNDASLVWNKFPQILQPNQGFVVDGFYTQDGSQPSTKQLQYKVYLSYQNVHTTKYMQYYSHQYSQGKYNQEEVITVQHLTTTVDTLSNTELFDFESFIGFIYKQKSDELQLLVQVYQGKQQINSFTQYKKFNYDLTSVLTQDNECINSNTVIELQDPQSNKVALQSSIFQVPQIIRNKDRYSLDYNFSNTKSECQVELLFNIVSQKQNLPPSQIATNRCTNNQQDKLTCTSQGICTNSDNSKELRGCTIVTDSQNNEYYKCIEADPITNMPICSIGYKQGADTEQYPYFNYQSNDEYNMLRYMLSHRLDQTKYDISFYEIANGLKQSDGQLKSSYIHTLFKNAAGELLYLRNEIKFQIANYQDDYTFSPVDIEVYRYVHWLDGSATVTGGINNDQIKKGLQNPSQVFFAASFNYWGNSTETVGQILETKTAIELGAQSTNRVDKENIWSILDLYRLNVTAPEGSILPISSFSVSAVGTNGDIFSKHFDQDNIFLMVPSPQEKETVAPCFAPTYKLIAPDDTEFAQSPYNINNVFDHVDHPRQNYTLHIGPTGQCDYKLVYAKLSIKQDWTQQCQYCNFGEDSSCDKYGGDITCTGVSPNYQCTKQGQALENCSVKTDQNGKQAVRCDVMSSYQGKKCSMVVPEGETYSASELNFGNQDYQPKSELEQYMADEIFEAPRGVLNLSPYLLNVLNQKKSNFYIHSIWYSQSENTAKYVQKPITFQVGYDFSKFDQGGNDDNNDQDNEFYSKCEVNYQDNQAEKSNFVFNDPQPRSPVKWGDDLTLNAQLPAGSQADQIKVVVSYIDQEKCSRIVSTDAPYLVTQSAAIQNEKVPFTNFVQLLIKKPKIFSPRLTYVAVGSSGQKVYHSHYIWIQPPVPQDLQTKPDCLQINVSAKDQNQVAMNTGTNGEFLISSQEYAADGKFYNFQINLEGAGSADCSYELLRTRLTTYQNLASECKSKGQCGSVNNACIQDEEGLTCTKQGDVWTCELDGVALTQSRQVTDNSGVKHVRAEGYDKRRNIDTCFLKLGDGAKEANFDPQQFELDYFNPVSQAIRQGESKEAVGLYQLSTSKLQELYNSRKITSQTHQQTLYLHTAIKNIQTGSIVYSIGEASIKIDRGVQCHDYNESENENSGQDNFQFSNGQPKTLVDFGSTISLTVAAKSQAAQLSAAVTYFDEETCTRKNIQAIELDQGSTSFDGKMIQFSTIYETINNNKDKKKIRLSFKATQGQDQKDYHMIFDYLPPHPEFISKSECFTINMVVTDPKSQTIAPNSQGKYLIKLRDYDLDSDDMFDLTLSLDTSKATGSCEFTPAFNQVVKYANPRSQCMEKNNCGGFNNSCLNETDVQGFNCELSPSLACTLQSQDLKCQVVKNEDQSKSFGKCKLDDPVSQREKCIIDTEGDTSIVFKKDDEQVNFEDGDNGLWRDSYVSPTNFKVSMNDYKKLFQNDPEEFVEGNFKIWTTLKNQSSGAYVFYETNFQVVVDRRESVNPTDVVEDQSKFQINQLKTVLKYKQDQMTIAKIIDDVANSQGGGWLIRAKLLVDGKSEASVDSKYGAIFDQKIWTYIDLINLLEPLGFETGIQTGTPEFKIQLVAVDPQGSERYSYTAEDKLTFRAADVDSDLSTDDCKVDTVTVTSPDGRTITKSTGDGNRFVIPKSGQSDSSNLTISFSKSNDGCTQDASDIIYSDLRAYKDDNLNCKAVGECDGAPDIACTLNDEFVCTDGTCVKSENQQCSSTIVTDEDSNEYNRCDIDMPDGKKICIIALQTGQTPPKFAPYSQAALLSNPINTLAREGRQDQKTYSIIESQLQPASKFNQEFVKFYYHVYQSNDSKDDIFYNRVQFELAFVDETARLIQTKDMKATLFVKYNEDLKVKQNVSLTEDAKLQGYSKINAIVKVIQADGSVAGTTKKKQFDPEVEKIAQQTDIYKYGELLEIALANQIYFSRQNQAGSSMYLYFVAEGDSKDPVEERASQLPIILLPPESSEKQDSISCITPTLSLIKGDEETQVKFQKNDPIEFNLWNVQNITDVYNLKLESAYESCSNDYKLLGVSVRSYESLAQICQSKNQCEGTPNYKCLMTPLTCTAEGKCTDQEVKKEFSDCATELINSIDYYRCNDVDQRTGRASCVIDSSNGVPNIEVNQDAEDKFFSKFNVDFPIFTVAGQDSDAALDTTNLAFNIQELRDYFERINKATNQIERSRFFANIFWINSADSAISYQQISFEINPMREEPKVELISGGPDAQGLPVIIPWGESYTVKARLSGVQDYSQWKLYTAIMDYGLDYATNQYGLVQKQQMTEGYDQATGEYERVFTPTEVLQKISYNKEPALVGLILDSPRHDNKLHQVESVTQLYLIPPNKAASDSADCQELSVAITTSSGQVATYDDVTSTFSLEQLPVQGKIEIKVTGSMKQGASCGAGSDLKKAFLRTFDDLTLQCLKSPFCDDRDVTPEQDQKLENFLNGAFIDRSTSNFSTDTDNQILISLEQFELQYGLKDPQTQQLQQIVVHSFWVKKDDNSLAYKNLSFKIDVKSTTQTDIKCDGSFCDLRMYPFINGLDASDMWGCDEETRKWGGKVAQFNRKWNEDVKIQLIPDLTQCKINYLDFLNQQTQVYDWALLRSKLNDDVIFNRMRKGWSIRYGHNQNEAPIIIGEDQAIETVLTESFLAENFKYNKYSSQDSVEICNWFDNCDYKVCYYVLLPSYDAPVQNSAVCGDNQVAIEIYQNGKKLDASQDGSYQIQETEPFQAKVVSVEQCHNGAQVFDVFVRTYADLQKEAGLRNKSDQIQNSQCYQEPMDCVQVGNGKHNCATMYSDFTGCENVQDLSGVTTIKCVKVYSGGYKHCSIKQPDVIIPQKDDNWKMCFDSGTWQNCPVEASCVPCADHRNEGQQDCVAMQKQGYKKQDFNCPPYKPGTNCQQYYDYVNQFWYTKTEFNWPEFEPYKKENQFFQRESFRTQDRKGVFIGELRNVNRFSHNQGAAYESNDVDYQIPDDGLQFNLHIMMKYPNPSKTGDSLIEYVSKAVTVKRQPSLIENSGYTINFRLNREVHFDSIVLSDPLKTGYNANLLPMEGLISYKNQTNVQLDKEQYAAGEKMYYVPYHRQQDYNTVKIKLLNRNFKTLAEAQMNLLAIPVSNPTNPLFSCIQITNDIKYEGKKSVTYRKNRMQLYQNVSISGEFFFNFDNCPDQTHYNLSQMTVRTFANLTDQCPIRRTCAPLNETCSYQVMYCNDEFREVITTDSRGNQKIQVKSQLVCYDLHGVKWDTCKKSTDEAGNTYTRCDSSAYNPTFRGMEYKCTIAIPPNTAVAPTHPLVSENCKYTDAQTADAKNQKCELAKGCIDELKTNKSFVNSTTECKLGDQLKKIRFFPKNNPFHSFSKDQKFRQLANDQFENLARFQGNKFQIPAEIWAKLQGESTSFFHFWFVDAKNPQNQPQYTRLQMPVYFATTDKPDPIWATLQLPQGENWYRRVDFGSDLTLTLTVGGIENAQNKKDYKVRVFVPGIEKPTQLDSGATFTISAEELLKIYGYSRWGADYSTGSQQYSFAAYNSRSKFMFDRVWLGVVINEPTTLTEPLKTSSITYVIKYDDEVEGKKDDASKWYVSGDRVTLIDYAVSLSDADYKVLDIEIRDFQDLTGDCGSRGTCEIPINRCSVQIMNCVPGQADKFICTNLYGQKIDTCTLKSDDNDIETYRCDFNEWWCGVKDSIRKHPLDTDVYPDGLKNISGCYSQDQNSCPFPVQCLNQQFQSNKPDGVSRDEDYDCTFMWEYMAKYQSAVSDHLYNDYKIEYWNQFDWPISQSNSRFNDYLGSQFYDRSKKRSVLYNYWEPEANGVKTLYVHLLVAKDGSVGYVRDSIDINYWKSDPTSAYQATFSVSKQQIPWGEGIDVTASTDNFDPTMSINIRATVFSEWASLFLDQNSTDNQFTISGSSLSINAADTLKAFGYSRYGGQGSIEFQVVSDDGQNIGAPKWLSPKLLGPIEAQLTACSRLNVVGRFKDAGQDIQLDGSALIIDLANLELGSDVKLTLSGYDHADCTQGSEIYQIMGRTYSDLSKDQEFQDPLKNKENCFPARIAEIQGEWYDMYMNYKYDNCSEETDFTGQKFTVCSTGDYCVIKDTANQHFAETNEYSKCADPATKSQCPILPYCLDYRQDPYSYLNEDLIKVYGWTLSQVVERLKVRELLPKVNWDSVIEKIGDSKTNVFKTIFEEFDVKLEDVIQEANPWTQCDVLFQDGGLYSTYNIPKRWQNDPSASSNKVIPQWLENELQYAFWQGENVGEFYFANWALWALMKEMKSYAAPFSLYLHILTMKSADTGYMRKQVQLKLQKPQLIPQIYSNFEPGATIPNIGQYDVYVSFEDYFYTSEDDYQVQWSCSAGLQSICAQANSATVYYEQSFLSFNEDDIGNTSGAATLTATITKKSTNEVKTKPLQFIIQRITLDCEYSLTETSYLIAADEGKKKQTIQWEFDMGCLGLDVNALQFTFKLNGVNCSWCNNAGVGRKGNSNRWYVKMPLSDIPANKEFTLDLQASYRVNSNLKTASKKMTVFKQAEPLQAYFEGSTGLIQGINGFKSEIKTNVDKNSQWRVREFSKCPDNYSKCSKLQKKINISSNELQSLGLEEGDQYQFTATVVTNDQRSVNITNTFSVTFQPQITELIVVPFVEKKWRVDNFGSIYFDLEPKDGKSWDLLWDLTYEWKVYKIGEDKKMTELQSNLFETYDITLQVPKDTFQPGTRYRIKVKATSASGKTVSAGTSIKMAPRGKVGKVKITSKDANMDQFSALRIMFNRFKKAYQYKIFCESNTDERDVSIIAESQKRIFRKINLSPSSDYKCGWIFIDKFGWEQKGYFDVTIATKQLSQITDISTVINPENPSALLKNAEQVKQRLGQDAFKQVQKTGRDFIENQINNNKLGGDTFIDADSLSQVAGSIQKMAKLLDTGDESSKDTIFSAIGSITQAFESGNNSMSTNQIKSTMESLGNMIMNFDQQKTKDSDQETTAKAKAAISKAVEDKLGGVKYQTETGQMEMKSFKSDQIRPNSTISLGSTESQSAATTKRSPCQANIPADAFTQITQAFGTAKVTASLTQQKPNSKIKASLQVDGNSVLDAVVQPQFAVGGSFIDLSSFTFKFQLKFNVSTFLENLLGPRLLQEVQPTTITTYTPQCQRNDSTSGWTTDGVQTVDNGGGSISCNTTKPGATSVVYIKKTTTTNTNPKPPTTNQPQVSSSSSSSVNIGLIVGLVVAAVVVIALIIIIVVVMKNKKKKLKIENQKKLAPVRMVTTKDFERAVTQQQLYGSPTKSDLESKFTIVSPFGGKQVQESPSGVNFQNEDINDQSSSFVQLNKIGSENSEDNQQKIGGTGFNKLDESH